MSDVKTNEYSNGEITVKWKPEVCIHAGECVKGSPEVFNPKEKPWVQIEGSTTEEIQKTIDKCPSGALSYHIEGSEESGETATLIRIKASKNGPYLVSGKLELEDRDGNVQVCEGKTTALCRCGASGNKPFCDGSHTNVRFYG
jgi:uncharacterized Fe-S cluster protein YjdI